MEERNNLDICFDLIFRNNVCFQIEDEEVNFIQTAIETLVSKLLDEIEIYGNEKKTHIISEFLIQHSGFKFVCDATENNEIFLKTGSFYEETKNGYPDEFDYVYVICTLEVDETLEEFTWRKHYFSLNEFHETIQNILTKKLTRRKYEYSQNGRCVYFDGYYRNQGPASKLTFRYKMKDFQTNKERNIDVDIVPAFKVIDKQLHERILGVCFIKDFAKRIVATGSYLITNEVSFTETEGLFMATELSPDHKKAFRLLKYILNGNGDGERLRKNIPKVGISTYMIKVATINHHFSRNCKSKPSVCVIMILEDILKFCIDYQSNTEPCIKKFHGGKFEMQADYVEQTVESIREVLRWLRSLKENQIMYDDIKSVSECIFDYTQMQSSTGHLSFSSSKSYSSSVSSRRLSISLTDTNSCRGRICSFNPSRQFEMYDSDDSTGPVSLLCVDSNDFEEISSYTSYLPESPSSCQSDPLKNATDTTQYTLYQRQSFEEDKSNSACCASSENQIKADLRNERGQKISKRFINLRDSLTKYKRDFENKALSNHSDDSTGLVSLFCVDSNDFEEISSDSSYLPESLSSCQSDPLKNATNTTQYTHYQRQSFEEDKSNSACCASSENQIKADLRNERGQKISKPFIELRDSLTEYKRDFKNKALSNQIYKAERVEKHIRDKDNIQRHGREQYERHSDIIVNIHDDNISSEGVGCDEIYGSSSFYSKKTIDSHFYPPVKSKKKRKKNRCILM